MLLTEPNTFSVSNRTIKNNHLFLVDTMVGEIPQNNSSGMGLYSLDTRFLSTYEIRLNATEPVCLLSSTESGYLSTLVYTNGRMPSVDHQERPCLIQEECLQLKRESILDHALFEKYTLISYNDQPAHLKIRMRFDADFRDMFEIRHLVPCKDRALPPTIVEDNTLIFRYPNPDKLMETRIRFVDVSPIHVDDHTVELTFLLYPLERHEFFLEITPCNDITFNSPLIPTNFEDARSRVHTTNMVWKQEVTEFLSDNDDFNEMLSRSHKDLRMLITQAEDGQQFIAAGIPWYVCLFGRDSIITARETLILNPAIAKWTLEILAAHQGQAHRPWQDEEAGKILHELRTGELARLKEIPHTPYYGSVDATPLWLILLYDYYLWTKDLETLERLWPHALAALSWIDRNLAKSPLGYATYETENHSGVGIVHQGWKDSNNSAMYENGLQAEPPIALSEVQGYVYLAKRRMATLADLMNDKALKARLREENQAFKKKFNRDFWMDDLRFCAMGLDSQGKPLRVIASNPGHCLETGIFTSRHAYQVVSRLMAPDMFSGWGIRTLSSTMAAYNPMSYHNGSIWPHDNAMIAAGMASMHRTDLSEKIFSGLFDAARLMAYKRLPELFCGFSRDRGKMDPPVRYPVACSPQAWAAASIYSLIQAMLHIVPDVPNNTLTITQPQLPHFMNRLRISNLHVGKATVDLEFRRTDKTVVVDVLNRSGKVDIIVKI